MCILIKGFVIFSGLNSCAHNPCGQNTKCHNVQGGYECSCVPGCSGDPHRGCLCQEPLIDSCRDLRCGINAACKTINNKPVCYCPPTYPLGDPLVQCKCVVTLVIVL